MVPVLVMFRRGGSWSLEIRFKDRCSWFSSRLLGYAGVPFVKIVQVVGEELKKAA